MDTEKIERMLDQILDELNQIHQLLLDRLPSKDIVKDLMDLKPGELTRVIKAAHEERMGELREN